MSLNWFSSRTVRQAHDMSRHVQKILDAQRDILSPAAVSAVETALLDLKNTIQANSGDEPVKKQMTELEATANKYLRPYPNAAIRENVEVLLVALAIALGIRTFFVQPFKIPTGSMQPTLFGVMPSPEPTSTNEVNLVIPNPIVRFVDFWVRGQSFYNILAPTDGQLQRVLPPQPFLLFNLKQQYQFNNQLYTVWFPADDLFKRAGYGLDYNGTVVNSPEFKAGDPVLRLKVTAGDHLFVDRVSYNFRHPKRGEIIVFETKGIGNSTYKLPPDQFFIKRLVALGGERVQIGKDRHLIIDGKRLDDTTPHFENLYNFDPNGPFLESHYSGHADAQYAPLFNDSPDGVVTVSPDHYMVMGDNTMNSFDSRYWGDFSRTNVIGKYLFVYWPFSSRFGWNVK
jgi:signal peptidase I